MFREYFLIAILGYSLSIVQAVKFQPIHTAKPQGSYLTETVRILTNYIAHYTVQCPSITKLNGQLVSFEELFWINENNDFAKPDTGILISSVNLVEKAQLTVRINQNIKYLSCGYFYQNTYVRIKQWKFVYVSQATVQLQITANPSVVSLRPINASTTGISVSGNAVNNWHQPQDLLRFKCLTNYDIPLDTKYVWMYYRNPDTHAFEIWHRDDIKGVEDPYQIFMYDRYNSVMNRNESVSVFIQQLLLMRVNSIEFQCASYKDNFQLLAKSHNISLIKDGIYFTNNPIYHTTAYPQATTKHYDNGPLIGGIIGGILGLLLLLALILLLVWCCCIRKTKVKETKVFYDNKTLASPSAVSAYPSERNIEITQDGWRNLSNNSTAFIHVPTQSTHTIESTKHQSHIEISQQQGVTSSNVSNNHMGHGGCGAATIRSECPEMFLKTITLPKDANEDIFQSYAQKDITYHGNNGYTTDEEFYAQRKEYFVNNSNNHQQQFRQTGTHYQYV